MSQMLIGDGDPALQPCRRRQVHGQSSGTSASGPRSRPGTARLRPPATSGGAAQRHPQATEPSRMARATRPGTETSRLPMTRERDGSVPMAITPGHAFLAAPSEAMSRRSLTGSRSRACRQRRRGQGHPFGCLEGQTYSGCLHGQDESLDHRTGREANAIHPPPWDRMAGAPRDARRSNDAVARASASCWSDYLGSHLARCHVA
jgi:hypothetical protein